MNLTMSLLFCLSTTSPFHCSILISISNRHIETVSSPHPPNHHRASPHDFPLEPTLDYLTVPAPSTSNINSKISNLRPNTRPVRRNFHLSTGPRQPTQLCQPHCRLPPGCLFHHPEYVVVSVISAFFCFRTPLHLAGSITTLGRTHCNHTIGSASIWAPNL